GGWSAPPAGERRRRASGTTILPTCGAACAGDYDPSSSPTASARGAAKLLQWASTSTRCVQAPGRSCWTTRRPSESGRASRLERSARRRQRGSLRVHQVGGPDIVVVSSLAKGFGVPMASVAGGEELVSRFEAE